MPKEPVLMCLLPMFLGCAPALAAADGQTAISAALQALESVHALSEVAISPDGRHVVYGSVLTGMRGGSAVDVSALFLADARDGVARAAPDRLSRRGVR